MKSPYMKASWNPSHDPKVLKEMQGAWYRDIDSIDRTLARRDVVDPEYRAFLLNSKAAIQKQIVKLAKQIIRWSKPNKIVTRGKRTIRKRKTMKRKH